MENRRTASRTLYKTAATVGRGPFIFMLDRTVSLFRVNAFALFLNSQRKWESPPLKDASITAFKIADEQVRYESHLVLPHGICSINLGNIFPFRTRPQKNLPLQECQVRFFSRYWWSSLQGNIHNPKIVKIDNPLFDNCSNYVTTDVYPSSWIFSTDTKR
jgi:hypothetical protein